jgi:hypothetical protein
MAPDRNRSRSFQVFVDGLNAILEDAGIEMQRGSQ